MKNLVKEVARDEESEVERGEGASEECRSSFAVRHLDFESFVDDSRE